MPRSRKQNKLDAMKLLGEPGIPAGAVRDTDELRNTNQVFSEWPV